MKALVVKLEHTNLMNRIDLLDWVCSPAINKGKQTDRYWIINTDTQIYNTYNDPDVNYMMAMLFRTNSVGYSSLMIMKNGTDYRPNSETRGSESKSGPGPTQQTDSPNIGEVLRGEPIPEVPASTPEPTDNLTRVQSAGE